MRLFIGVLLAIWCSGFLPGAFAQDATATSSGFAVVTVISGNVAGLIATETLENRTNGSVEQTIVAPSPLITSASILAPVGPMAENTTALAIANPSAGSGGVNLVLTNPAGAVISTATFVLGPHGQFSRYLNDIFATQSAGFSTPLLLTVSSEIPIAILALNFRGADFTPIPLTSLSSPTPVPVQPLPSSTFSTSITPPPAGSSPGFGIGLPPPPPPPTAGPLPATTSQMAPAAPFVGGTAALVFAQVAAGGGWSTELAIGNTSSGSQTIRIDFFGSDGFHSSSIPEIVIPARGVFFLSSDSAAGVIQ